MAQTQGARRKPPIGAVVGKLHVFLYRLSGGRIGGKMAGQKIIVMNVVGRRSGAVRPTPVVGIEHEGLYYAAATHNGAPENPQWFLNLKACPDIAISVDGRERPATAEVLDEPERSRIWALMIQQLPMYGSIGKKTERVIPVVRFRERRLHS